jgi:hypothetical protein
MSKKHFIVTFENDKAQTTETLVWARENFQNYNEQKTTHEEVYFDLVDKKGFRLVSDDEKFVCYNFKPSIIALNNAIFNVTDNYFNKPEDFYIYFTIDNDEYNLSRSGSVTLIKNNQNITPVKRELEIIIRNRLLLNANIINSLINYQTGGKRNTRDMASKLNDYLRNPNTF